MSQLTSTHRARIERAIQHLRTMKLPEGAKFDMGMWGQNNRGRKSKKDNYCGTTACAGGWLSLDPWFLKRGLVGEWGICGLKIWCKGSDGYDALAKFFGLSWSAASVVFTAGPGNRTRQSVARKLERILENEVIDG